MEDLSKHQNYKYTPNSNGGCDFRKATKEEIDAGRKKFYEAVDNNPESIGMRSCYECNQAHGHLMEDCIIRCFGCGKVFVDGVDIVDYEN